MLDNKALLDDLKLLEQAAREAGKIALGYFGADPKKWLKDNRSPVSEADLAVDTYLADVLCSARPDYGWLSEETVDNPDRLKCKRTFIVDPIDGTRAFLSGSTEWTISIAIVEAGHPVCAALFCPVRDEMLLAVKGQGTTLNGEPLSVLEPVETEGARVSGPHVLVTSGVIEKMGMQQTPVIRSLAYRIALVAMGQADIALARHNAHDWDLAAADLLVQEAGGKLTGFDGKTVLYNQPVTQHPALIAASRSMIATFSGLFRDSVESN